MVSAPFLTLPSISSDGFPLQNHKVKSSLITSYSRTKRDDIADLMGAETWMTAVEAVEMGFADTIAEKVNISNSFDLSRFKHVPKNLADKPQAASQPAPAPSGHSIEYAKAVLRLNSF